MSEMRMGFALGMACDRGGEQGKDRGVKRGERYVRRADGELEPGSPHIQEAVKGRYQAGNRAVQGDGTQPLPESRGHLGIAHQKAQTDRVSTALIVPYSVTMIA